MRHIGPSIHKIPQSHESQGDSLKWAFTTLFTFFYRSFLKDDDYLLKKIPRVKYQACCQPVYSCPHNARASVDLAK